MTPPVALDYPLQTTSLDITTTEAMRLSPAARLDYCLAVIRGFAKVTTKNEFFLKQRIPVAKELKELRAMVALEPDAHLRLDEGTFQKDVLGRPTPTHGTHTEHASRAMARMRTKFGSVTNEVTKAAAWSHAHPGLARLEYEQMPRSSVPSLVKRLDALLDISNTSKDAYREGHEQILSTICRHLISHFNLRTAFPPFHARFLVSRYAPARGPVVVLDPCAGWGGRLLGTLTIQRPASVCPLLCVEVRQFHWSRHRRIFQWEPADCSRLRKRRYESSGLPTNVQRRLAVALRLSNSPTSLPRLAVR